MEMWKRILNFPDYEVSNLGRVRSNQRKITYSDGRVRVYPSKILTPGESGGYPFVNVFNGQIRKSIKIHVLVAAAFIGKRPAKNDVCHINGIKHDNRVENLEYGTRTKNILDNYRVLGYANKNQKLNHFIAKDVRKRIANGESRRSIARAFCVSKSTVDAINRGDIYNSQVVHP